MLSKDSTSPLKQQLHCKNKGCAFALINSFNDNENEEAGDDSDTNDTNNDGPDQDMPPSKKARNSTN